MISRDDTTPAESEFVEALRRDGTVDGRVLPGRFVRAEALAAVVRGDPGFELPSGRLLLRIVGCEFDGPLILPDVRSELVLEFLDSTLEFVGLPFGRINSIRFRGCRLGGLLGLPAIDALSARLDSDLRIEACSIMSTCNAGAVRLDSARIGGNLIMNGTRITNYNGPTLRAVRVEVAGHIRLANQFASSSLSRDGGIQLDGASAGADLDAGSSTFFAWTGPALSLVGARIGGNLILANGFRAATTLSAVLVPTVDLSHAEIAGIVSLAGADITNDAGPALLGQFMCARGAMYCHGMVADGEGQRGAVNLSHSSIAGSLDLTDAKLRSRTGPALEAENLRVVGSIHAGGLAAEGMSERATLLMPYSHVGKQIHLDSAYLANPIGSCLFLASSNIGEGLHLTGQFRAIGSGPRGVVQLSNATMGTIEVADAEIRSTNGAVLQCDNIRVRNSFQLLGPLLIDGSGELGAVRLVAAEVGIQLVVGRSKLDQVAITNPSGPALQADSLRASSVMVNVRLAGVPTLALDNARIGELRLHLSHFGPDATFSLDGATYRQRPGNGPARAWSRALTAASFRYTAQPYEQLAKGFREVGQFDDARSIMIEQENTRRREVDKPQRRESRGWHRVRLSARSALLSIRRVLIGYGYRPARALWYFATFPLVAIALVFTVSGPISGSHTGAVDRPPQHIDEKRRPCQPIEKIGLGLRMTLPVIGDVTTGSCEIDSSTTDGQILDAAGFLLQTLAWITATFGVLGLTGVVRPDRA